MATHCINLQGPWRWIWLSGEVLDEQSGRVTMPASWRDIFGSQSGIAEFQRRFQKPTNLEPDDGVFLAFYGIGGQSQIRVNGIELARDVSSPITIGISDVLNASNLISVVVIRTADGPPPDCCGLFDRVVLEIRSGNDSSGNS